MSKESFHDGVRYAPEYFEGIRSLDGVLFEYEMLTRQTVGDHHARFADIAPTHQAAFNAELQNPGSQNINTVMHNTKSGVQQAVKPVVEQVDGIVTSVANVIPTMLDANSRQILEQAKAQAASYGIGSQYVENVLSKAGSDKYPALKAALDYMVHDNVKSKVQAYGVDSHYVDQSIRLASSEYVQTAIRATLDSPVFDRVMANKNSYGVQSKYVDTALSLATSPIIKMAMKTALDDDVLASAKTQAKAYGMDSKYVFNALSHASSETVRKVFEKQFTARQGSSQQSSWERTRQDTYGGSSSGARYQGGQQGHDQQQHSRQETMAPKPDKFAEVKNIIAEVVSRDKQYSWLVNESPQDIRRIMNTVRKLRSDADARGALITDRQIYLKYRAKAETKPELIRSVQILDAFMGGDLNGKLPF